MANFLTTIATLTCEEEKRQMSTDAKRETAQARTQTEDGHAKFEREQQEAWLARCEGWTE